MNTTGKIMSVQHSVKDGGINRVEAIGELLQHNLHHHAMRNNVWVHQLRREEVYNIVRVGVAMELKLPGSYSADICIVTQ